MEELYYNYDKLIKISTSDKIKDEWWDYKPERKFFGYVIREEGFYDCLGGYLNMNASGAYWFIKGKIMYTKPSCRLCFENNHSHTEYFNTLSEANNYAKTFISGENWLFDSGEGLIKIFKKDMGTVKMKAGCKTGEKK